MKVSFSIRIWLAAVLLLLGLAPAGAQSVRKLVKQGDDAFYTAHFREAAGHYEQALKERPASARLHFRLGFSYLMLKESAKALPHLRVAGQAGDRYQPEISYLLAQAYHLQHKLDSAIYFYHQFEVELDDSSFPEFEVVEKNIQECRNGIAFMKRPIPVVIENLGPNINSPYADFVPVVTADESMLVFTSRREGNVGKGLPKGETEAFEDIYFSKKENGSWGPAKNIGPPINTALHDACIALSPDGKQIFLYRDVNGGDIFRSDFHGTDWSKPEPLPAPINSPYYEPSMSISDDGDYIFFSSNRPGGYGGLDIYVSQRQRDQSWGEPINLGATINTPYDEDAPFLQSESNTLFFSSRGHNSMGGYDLFRSRLQAITWSDPQNVGWPVNTADDDIYFTITANGRHGYYASVKEGGLGEKDIYRIKFPVDTVQLAAVLDTGAIAQFTNPPSAWLTGQITDAAGKPLPARLSLVRYDDPAKKVEVTANASGRFRVEVPSGFQYGLAAQHPGYLFYSENLPLTAAQTGDTIRKSIKLRPLSVGATVVLRNIQFAVNKAELTPESIVELERLVDLLQRNPGMRVEISGHTDNTGPAAYNQKLSRLRAQAVVSYLAGKGISAGRLKAVGYGSAKPFTTNATEQGRQLNRRTEFKILQK